MVLQINLGFTLGTIHLRRRHALGGEGSKIVKICRRLKWMVPFLSCNKGEKTMVQTKMTQVICKSAVEIDLFTAHFYLGLKSKL